jgi:uncharacterized protein YwgA
MTEEQKDVVLLSFIDHLRRKGSWCGETHVQKGTYFLQELAHVPLEFEFIFYKHGPYSFELNDEITSLLADLLLSVKSRDPYGPTIVHGENASKFVERFPKTRERYRSQIEFVAKRLGKKNVTELERLATALFVTKNELPKGSVEVRAARINELKPHVPLPLAQEAVEEFDRLVKEATGFKGTSP